MKNHAFEGKVTDKLVTIMKEDQLQIIQTVGQPIVVQIKGATKGAMAQICAICGETAAEDGTTLDHIKS